jgi:ubiquinone/menaquinone biosynthesis C-methylase UbiE
MSESSFSQATFAQSNFAELYERMLVAPLFRPFVDDLLERVRLAPGDRLLDLACGTGVVARAARERLGAAVTIVGVDASPQMLAVASSVAPGIEWRQGNAGALPVDDSERFDVIVCQQGLQFFPDKPAAAREMRRVIARGGRLAVSAWRPLEEIPMILALHRVAERHLGAVTDRRHAYGDAGTIRQLFAGAGFGNVSVDTVSRTLRFDEAGVFLRLNAMALVNMSSAAEGMNEESRAALADTIADDSRSVLQPFAEGPAIVFEMRTNVLTAHAE